MQMILNEVEPWGEDRADMRAAWNTTQRIASDRMEPMSDTDFDTVFDQCSRYLKCHHPPDEDDEDDD